MSVNLGTLHPEVHVILESVELRIYAYIIVVIVSSCVPLYISILQSQHSDKPGFPEEYVFAFFLLSFVRNFVVMATGTCHGWLILMSQYFQENKCN